MNIVFITYFFVGFMVSEIPRVSVFDYFLLHYSKRQYNYLYVTIRFSKTYLYI